MIKRVKFVCVGAAMCLTVAMLSGCNRENRIEKESLAENVVEEESTEIPIQGKTFVEELSNKNVSYEPLKDPDNKYHLNQIINIHMIEMLTGENSSNKTLSRFNFGGTDLGVMFNKGDKTFIAFGDTYINTDHTGRWRSNTLAITTDSDYTDGITIEQMITEQGSTDAREVIQSKKIDHIENTTIPTGALVIGEDMYLAYMSVKEWGEAGSWNCNYGSFAKSTDGGQSWSKLEELSWEGTTHFAQMYPMSVEEMIYVPGITGGRNGEAQLMRVQATEFEEKEAYEYLTGYEQDGTPIFDKDIGEAVPLIPGAVGEMSFMYSEYLEEWIVTHMYNNSDLVVRTSKQIWGPYSEPVTIASQQDFPGLYGAFLNPRYVSADGSKVAFLMSLWEPYNVAIMEMELVKK